MADILITIEDDAIDVGVGSQGDQIPAATQAEAEAGTAAGLRSWSPLRVAQAIAAKGAALFAAITHASRHAAAGADPVTPSAIGAYRQTATNAVGNVSGSVTADFATSLTNTYTLTGNCTALPAPTNLADGETGIGLFTLAGFTMPTGPASGCYKGNWTVTGTLVRVVYQRIGALYMVSADSLTVVT